jgi:hypothetical protein
MPANRTSARPAAPRPVATPRPVGPLALAAALRRPPPLPTSLASLLDGRSGAPAFRRIVEAIFPAHAPTILTAERPGTDRRAARVAAFLARVEAECFPVYTLDDWYADDEDPYDFVTRGIPFQRLGWGEEDYHELDRRDGHRLLFALCRQPYDDAGAHLALLESLEPLVPLDTLLRLPLGGLPAETIHARLDGGRFTAAAEFADWIWGATGTAFLDYDDTVEIYDADWTRGIVDELVAQWRRADAMLRRIDDLAGWLETDPPARFGELLDAALREAGASGDDADGATGDARDGGDGGGDDGHIATDCEHDGDAGGRPLPARHAA